MAIVGFSDAWIGGYKASDGVWRWVGSDAPMNATFDHWASGLPTTGQNVQIQRNGNWKDETDDDHFICEVV
jgi:hypothetical protein